MRHAAEQPGPIDYGALLSVLAEWAETDDIARILVRNPAKLYDFD